MSIEKNKYVHLDFEWCNQEFKNIINKHYDDLDDAREEIGFDFRTLPDQIEEDYYNVLMDRAEELNSTYEEWIDDFQDRVAGDRQEFLEKMLDDLFADQLKSS